MAFLSYSADSEYKFRALNFAGSYMIYGTVKNPGTPDYPVYRRVRLHDMITSQIVDETYSDSVTGAYVFRHIANRKYYVVSFDHTGTYNGVVATDVAPILMP